MRKHVINDLFDYGLKIVQDYNGFKFSLDSILIAEFVEIKEGKKIIDLCSGNIPIPLILSTKINSKIYGMELQKDIYLLAKKTLEINNTKNIEVINDDIKKASRYFKNESFDIVTCNPPYFKYLDDRKINVDKVKGIARHEITITLEDVIKTASFLLKNKGEFYLVHQPERISEIFCLLATYNLSPKKIQFIYSTENKNAKIILIKAVKNGKSGVKVLKNVCIKNAITYKNLVGD